MESDDEGERRLPVEQRDDGKLVIDTSEDAIDAINDVVHDRDEQGEIEYVIALRKVIRYAQADWFNCSRAIDEQPPDPNPVDEEALEREVAELERELAEEHGDDGEPPPPADVELPSDENFYEDGPAEWTPDAGETVDKEALAEALRDIEEELSDVVIEELSGNELRELLCEIREQKEEFEAAMEMDHSEFLQDDAEEE